MTFDYFSISVSRFYLSEQFQANVDYFCRLHGVWGMCYPEKMLLKDSEHRGQLKLSDHRSTGGR